MQLRLALLALAFLSGSAFGQRATVVATCGTAPGTWAAGEIRPLLQNTDGEVCVSGAGGGSGAPTDAHYYTNQAEAGLSAEVVPAANVITLLGSADNAAMRTNLGLVIGTNVQAFDADLSTYAGITPSASAQTFLASTVGTAANVNTGTSGATIPLLNAANTWSATQATSGTAVFTPQIGSVTAPSFAFATDLDTGLYQQATDGYLAFASNGALVGAFRASSPQMFTAYNGTGLGFSSGASAPDVTMFRDGAAATLRHGAADAASPVAQIDTVQDVVAGTSNTAGADRTFAGSQGTGTGAGGSVLFKTAPAGSTGTSQNALATAFTVQQYGPQLPAAVTVANLPACAAGLAGVMRAVSDATAWVTATAPTGGGSVYSPVICNGTAWVAF